VEGGGAAVAHISKHVFNIIYRWGRCRLLTFVITCLILFIGEGAAVARISKNLFKGTVSQDGC
jgi:hypothetical protein